MTPLPKKKMSRSRSLKRKGSAKTRLPNLFPCSQCKKLILPHIACPYCGSYKSHSVVDLAIKSKTRIVKEGR